MYIRCVFPDQGELIQRNETIKLTYTRTNIYNIFRFYPTPVLSKKFQLSTLKYIGKKCGKPQFLVQKGA